MIVVTGGTGRLGSQIVDGLLQRVPADRVGVSVRDLSRAAGLAARGVRVRHGDFTDPASLTDAFEGAAQVLIVSANAAGDEAMAQHRAAVDAAVSAGRVLYTSHQGASAGSAFAPMADHAATESYLEASGAPFTSLRNGFYASTFELLLPPALATGELIACIRPRAAGSSPSPIPRWSSCWAVRPRRCGRSSRGQRASSGSLTSTVVPGPS